MNKRTFNKHLRACSTKGKLDIAKVSALPTETKTAIALHLVRYRVPIVIEFLTGEVDKRMLAGCGYLYTTKGKEYTFLHTCEHVIK